MFTLIQLTLILFCLRIKSVECDCVPRNDIDSYNDLIETMDSVLQTPLVGHMTVEDVLQSVIENSNNEYLELGWNVFLDILDQTYICGDFDRIMLKEGNDCLQDNLGTVGLGHDLNFQETCMANDEARSLLITGPLPKGTKIIVCDNPDCQHDDDYSKIVLKQDFCEWDTYCISSFEQNINDEWIVMAFYPHNGLDGKVSHITVKDPNSDVACFPGSSQIFKLSSTQSLDANDMELGWENVRMDSILVGDTILTANQHGELSPSTVVYLPHSHNDNLASFLEIKTKENTLKLTSSHLIMICDDCESCYNPRLVYAYQVETGQCVLEASILHSKGLLDSNNILFEDKARSTTVISVKKVVDSGLYTLVTDNEFLIVNGVIVSPFETAHSIAHNFYEFHRAAYHIKEYMDL